MFDPVQLRTFLAVAQTLSFTQAAPPAGPAPVDREPARAQAGGGRGRRLFSRDTHRVELTEDGEAMLGFARTILEANERAAAFFAGTRLRGRLRFGASEDFVLTRLPEILEGFRRDHPEVDLELTVELSATLHRQLAAGRLDLVLGKRAAGDTHGQLVWRDRLVWIAATLPIDPAPVPLILYPPPGITRARALEVLERNGRDGKVYTVSVSLLRVGVTSELRLEMEELKRQRLARDQRARLRWARSEDPRGRRDRRRNRRAGAADRGRAGRGPP